MKYFNVKSLFVLPLSHMLYSVNELVCFSLQWLTLVQILIWAQSTLSFLDESPFIDRVDKIDYQEVGNKVRQDRVFLAFADEGAVRCGVLTLLFFLFDFLFDIGCFSINIDCFGWVQKLSHHRFNSKPIEQRAAEEICTRGGRYLPFWRIFQ